MNNNIFTFYQQFRQNPVGMIGQKYNISQGVNTNDPNAILQDLLNTGQITQDQINRVAQMRQNPLVQMLMRGR